MSCKQNQGNYPPGRDKMTEEEVAYWDRLNAHMDALADAENGYLLDVFNGAKRNYDAEHQGGRQKDQARDWNAPPAPEQPKEICHWMDYSQWPPDMFQMKGETGKLLGEPYQYPKAQREEGQVQLGPLVPELSQQPQFSVYVDQDSAVPVGTVWQEITPGGQAPDGSRFQRHFRLVQDGESKRFWYQTAAPE